MKHNNILHRTLAIVFAMLAGNTCIAQGPFNIGNIHPGDSIVIYYDVTINNPLVPPNAPSISNQGTVSGSNFASLPTKGPASPAGVGATITLLNTPLPVVFSEFKAYKREHSVALTWRIVTEENAWKYEVEKSADARVFKKIGEVIATGGHGIINYGFTDEDRPNGNTYYRLKALDLDYTFTYTRIVKVSTDVATSGSNFYPNPVTEKSFNLELLDLVKGQYELILINTSGQIIYTKKVGHPGGTATHLISVPGHATAGVYSAEIKGDNITINKKLVIE